MTSSLSARAVGARLDQQGAAAGLDHLPPRIQSSGTRTYDCDIYMACFHGSFSLSPGSDRDPCRRALRLSTVQGAAAVGKNCVRNRRNCVAPRPDFLKLQLSQAAQLTYQLAAGAGALGVLTGLVFGLVLCPPVRCGRGSQFLEGSGAASRRLPLSAVTAGRRRSAVRPPSPAMRADARSRPVGRRSS